MSTNEKNKRPRRTASQIRRNRLYDAAKKDFIKVNERKPFEGSMTVAEDAQIFAILFAARVVADALDDIGIHVSSAIENH